MKINYLSFSIAIMLPWFYQSALAEMKFNPQFLSDDNARDVDLSWIARGSEIPPGQYNLSVYLNRSYLFTDLITLDYPAGSKKPELCFSEQQIKSLGMISSEKHDMPPRACYFLSQRIPGVKSEVDVRTLSAQLTIAQRNLKTQPRGYIDPHSWDNGIPSVMLNYILNGSYSHYADSEQANNQRLFIGLNSSVNLGGWRLHDTSTWAAHSSERLSHVRSWAQRDMSDLQAQFKVGETFASPQIFDPVGLTGMTLESDESMLPTSQRGYAPEVRGIAEDNATVTVRQNGAIIYQNTVPQGEFVFKDLFPIASGGDLQVQIAEENGRVSEFTVPFASVPNLVRPGQIRYSLAAGRYRSGSNQDNPLFFQGEIFYGWDHGLTFYSGTQMANRYQALAGGLGQNLGMLGAYSVDAIQARSLLADDHIYQGSSVRLRYSKLLNNASTLLNFYAWRFSTQRFYTLSDTTYQGLWGGSSAKGDLNGEERFDSRYDLRLARKSKNQLMLSHNMGSLGSLSLSWNRQTYWHSARVTEGINGAWNNSWGDLSWGISFQHNTTLFDHRKDNVFALSLSLPLGERADSRRVNYSMTHSASSGFSQGIGIGGYLPQQPELYYNVSQHYSRQQQVGGDVALQYKNAVGNYHASYSYARKSRTLSYGTSGGMVLHEDGLTLSQPLGETNILVKAPGAAHVAIRNHRGLETDSRGYAVIPYASPYQVNRVELDVNTLSPETELKNPVASTLPGGGAMTRVEFSTQIGKKAMLYLNYKQGQVPFGATASLVGENLNSSIVGDSGGLYMSGLPQQGELNVRWGKGAQQSCKASYRLDKAFYNARSGLYSQEVTCL
ncbi:MAG: fimbria/pilus outer membrane usher protein [Pantoea sp.]|nr:MULTISPECIES: fimbria/pilus outer membrane usher protein [Pantoea]MDU5779504.1 fimbria/pilus outer membrane usher protein [Pantoea sp.]